MSGSEEPTHESERSGAITRRRLIATTSAAGAMALGSNPLGVATALAAASPPPRPKTPAGVLKALIAGNARYVSGKTQSLDYNQLGNRIAATQKPLAAIITCADSRISPPVIFDVGAGNVFVSRVAGNSIDTATLGSTEYAVAVLGVHLVMVLGHSDCGAVKSAIAVVNGKKSFPPQKYGAIGALVAAITPSIRALPPACRTLDRSIATNAQDQAKRIARRGPIVKPAVGSGLLAVVAAVYDIATGRVSLV